MTADKPLTQHEKNQRIALVKNYKQGENKMLHRDENDKPKGFYYVTGEQYKKKNNAHA